MSDIYTDGTYLANNPNWHADDSPWKAGEIAKLIAANRLMIEVITDVGCGAGAVLKELATICKDVKRFEGYDISEQAIRIAKTDADERINFMQEDFVTRTATSKTGLLLMIDVVEHVKDYYAFMEGLSGKADYYIFHIPLDLSARTLLKPHILFQQRESVGHLHYFSKDMVDWLLKDSGFEVIDWHYTKPMGDMLKPSGFWQASKRLLRNVSFAVNTRLSVKLWGGYSMLILATDRNK
jgi:predicted TPR repeat methyltransferase